MGAKPFQHHLPGGHSPPGGPGGIPAVPEGNQGTEGLRALPAVPLPNLGPCPSGPPWHCRLAAAQACPPSPPQPRTWRLGFLSAFRPEGGSVTLILQIHHLSSVLGFLSEATMTRKSLHLLALPHLSLGRWGLGAVALKTVTEINTSHHAPGAVQPASGSYLMRSSELVLPSCHRQRTGT